MMKEKRWKKPKRLRWIKEKKRREVYEKRKTFIIGNESKVH